MVGAQVFEADFSRPRILLCVGFGVLGLFLMGVIGDDWARRPTSTGGVMIGVVIVGLLGLFLLRNLRLLAKGSHGLRIDASGLLDRQVSDRPIPWEFVGEVRIRKIPHRVWGFTWRTVTLHRLRHRSRFRGRTEQLRHGTATDDWVPQSRPGHDPEFRDWMRRRHDCVGAAYDPIRARNVNRLACW